MSVFLYVLSRRCSFILSFIRSCAQETNLEVQGYLACEGTEAVSYDIFEGNISTQSPEVHMIYEFSFRPRVFRQCRFACYG
jgi:hypothetical protein